MLRVELKDLHNEAGSAAEYLASKAGRQVKTRGTALEIENISAKDVKLLLHKFLHHRGLDGYRVVVVHPGLLEILPPEHQGPHGVHEGKGSPPTAPVTMPYYFPGSGSFLPPVKRKKGRREE